MSTPQPEPPTTVAGAAADQAARLAKLHSAMAEKLEDLAGSYAELKDKQLTLAILVGFAAVGLVAACIGFVCWLENQPDDESTESPYDERTRRFRAALGPGTDGDEGAAAAAEAQDPYAERQKYFRQQVQILPADDDEPEPEPELEPEPEPEPEPPLRQRKRSGSAAATRPAQAAAAVAAVAGAASTNKKTDESEVAVTAQADGAGGGGGWWNWLVSGGGGGGGATAAADAYAERQKHFRQQITILPADDVDD
jgi:outer membrane biosynthesis protein TonB